MLMCTLNFITFTINSLLDYSILFLLIIILGLRISQSRNIKVFYTVFGQRNGRDLVIHLLHDLRGSSIEEEFLSSSLDVKRSKNIKNELLPHHLQLIKTGLELQGSASQRHMIWVIWP